MCAVFQIHKNYILMVTSPYTRAVCKVRVLTLLLRVGTLWRCGNGLFSEAPPLPSGALLTTLHSFRRRAADGRSFRNFFPRSSLFMVGKAQKSHEARFGLYGGCYNEVPPIAVSAFTATSTVCGLPTQNS
jgi:hypothetical protein